MSTTTLPFRIGMLVGPRKPSCKRQTQGRRKARGVPSSSFFFEHAFCQISHPPEHGLLGSADTPCYPALL